MYIIKFKSANHIVISTIPEGKLCRAGLHSSVSSGCCVSGMVSCRFR